MPLQFPSGGLAHPENIRLATNSITTTIFTLALPSNLKRQQGYGVFSVPIPRVDGILNHRSAVFVWRADLTRRSSDQMGTVRPGAVAGRFIRSPGDWRCAPRCSQPFGFATLHQPANFVAEPALR